VGKVLQRSRVTEEGGASRTGAGADSGTRPRRSAGPTVARAVATFALSGLAAIALLGGALALVLRNAGTAEAIREARHVSNVVGHGIVEPVLRDSLLQEDPRALAALDRVVGTRVLDSNILRVKIWDATGRIVYSDKRRLIGTTYPLGDEEIATLHGGPPDAEVSDLQRPENRFERSFGELLEVYLPVQTPDGTPLLFETYLRFSSVTSSGHKVWLSFLPVLLGGLALLALLQVPLAWAMARRLERGREERERLLLRAVDASAAERRRIAGDLHDGVVQDFAGLSMSLSAAADRAQAEGATEAAGALRHGAERTRHGMRQLRTLLVEIYPPNLHTAGLDPALSDLLAPLAARGLRTSLEVDPALEAERPIEALVFRAAQEALRNVQAHAEAGSVDVRLERAGGSLVLTVRDDGRGFSADDLTRSGREGHMGLPLLRGLAEEAGGRLGVQSEPGAGTTVRLEVPAR
jgi:two-component system, NarL family, sensor kinase